MLTLADVERLSPEELEAIPREERLRLLHERLEARAQQRKENQLYFYEPVSPEAKKIHLSRAHQVVVVGGNRSSKTDSVLAELAIRMTGIVPFSLEDCYPKERIRCPIRTRIVCASLTNTWEPVIKPKLQWDKWNGRGEPGGEWGHWGWIPKRFLLKGSWSESWSEKFRTLTLTCGCSVQAMSYDQDIENFSGGSFHVVMHDEGPPRSIYRENKMRVLDVAGQLMTAMTPPDDEGTAFDAAWVYDELYSKGLPGPSKDPDIDSFTLFTEQNRILDKLDIEQISKGLSVKQRQVRLFGAFIHLGGRIYRTYTDRPAMWCFHCNDTVMTKDGCLTCGGSDTVEYCHFVEPQEQTYQNPCVFIIDPHPRKPVMMAWVAIDPWDDWWLVANLEVDGDPEVVRDKVADLEGGLKLNIVCRIIDPNMGRSQAHNAGRRHITVAEEYGAVGLRCNDMVSDDFNIGRTRIASRLKPDPMTRAPRLRFFNTCTEPNLQFNRFTWDEYSRYYSDEHDPKAVPRQKYSDYPTMIGYLANLNPTFAGLKMGTLPMRRKGRRGAY